MNANQSLPLLRVRNKAALAVLVLVPLVTTCGRQQQLRFDAAWSPSETFSTSGYARLAKLNGLPVCIDGNDYYFLRPDGTTWEKRTFSSAVEIPNTLPQTDSTSPKFILHDGNAGFGNVRDGQFQARIACCSLDQVMGVRTIFDRSLTLSRNELVGTNTTPTCEIPFPPAWKAFGPPQIVPEEGHLGGSLILGKDVYVSYSVRCGSLYGPNPLSGTGPNKAGLLWGNADGSRWTKLKLLDFDTSFEQVLATSNNIYFLTAPGRGLEKGLKRGLRSVRLPRAMNPQPTTEIVAPTVAMNGGDFAAATEGGTVHLAWLDGRHERDHPIRSMLTDTPSLEGNWELYYRHRKDSDPTWSEEILLSKGLDFTFDPSIAAEGQHIVVVSAGYKRDGIRAVARLHPSDIFFTTSSDGGKSWKPMAQITTNARSGQTSVRPQVALHKGMIHLFYEAGGLVYQRRPFPKD